MSCCHQSQVWLQTTLQMLWHELRSTSGNLLHNFTEFHHAVGQHVHDIRLTRADEGRKRWRQSTDTVRGDRRHRGNLVRRPDGEWQSRSVRGGGQGWDCKAKERCGHGFALNSHWASKYHTNTHAQRIHTAYSLKWESNGLCSQKWIFLKMSPKVRIIFHLCGTFTKKRRDSILPLADTLATSSTEWAWMSHGEVCAHINTELCVQGGEGNEMGLWGRGGGGWQLTGTSFQYHLEGDYPVCRDKRGEEGTDEEEEQKDQQIRGHTQRIGSASGSNRAKESRVRTTSKCLQEENVFRKTSLMLRW